MIGQFFYTMIKASTDKDWLLWLIIVFDSAGNLSTSNEVI